MVAGNWVLAIKVEGSSYIMGILEVELDHDLLMSGGGNEASRMISKFFPE